MATPFEFEHVIARPADEVLARLADPAFYAAFGALPATGPVEVLERAEDGDLVRLRLRYRFTGDLPAAARRVLDPERLTWVDHVTVDRARGVATSQVVPDHHAERLQASATHRVEATGPATCRWHGSGEVRVSFPLVAKAVERAIASGLRTNLAAEAALFVTS